MKLSIIVPIYKVEKYIHRCLESIFRQGIDEENYEVILINNGTPDKSTDSFGENRRHNKKQIKLNSYD